MADDKKIRGKKTLTGEAANDEELLAADEGGLVAAAVSRVHRGISGRTRRPTQGWINSVLNDQKSDYAEGDSVPVRLQFSDLDVAAAVQTLKFQVQVTKDSKHSYDYFTSYNRTETVDPCSGITCPAGAPTTFTIPPNSGANNKPSGGANFTMWGGTITGISYTNPPSFVGDQVMEVAVTFVATAPDAVMAFGAHISHPDDWDIGKTASNVRGAPYHLKLLSISGTTLGAQALNLNADAVIPAPVLTMAKTENAADPVPIGGSFNYTVTLTNSGFAAKSGVSVSDAVPAEFDVTGCPRRRRRLERVGSPTSRWSARGWSCRPRSGAPTGRSR